MVDVIINFAPTWREVKPASCFLELRAKLARSSFIFLGDLFAIMQDGALSYTYFMYPYALIYVDNNYYLLAFDTHGRRRHFRVDRMEEVRIHTWSFSREKYDAKVDLEHYTKYTFSMYGKGDIVRVTMRFDNNLVSIVLDRFGHDIMLVKDGDSHFTVTEPIAVSPQFFAWIFGLGEKAEIVGPVEVRKQMCKMMEKAIRQYKPEQ